MIENSKMVCIFLVVESGADIRHFYDKNAILLVNHQSTADVPTIMCAFSQHRVNKPNPFLLPHTKTKHKMHEGSP